MMDAFTLGEWTKNANFNIFTLSGGGGVTYNEFQPTRHGDMQNSIHSVREVIEDHPTFQSSQKVFIGGLNGLQFGSLSLKIQ